MLFFIASYLCIYFYSVLIKFLFFFIFFIILLNYLKKKREKEKSHFLVSAAARVLAGAFLSDIGLGFGSVRWGGRTKPSGIILTIGNRVLAYKRKKKTAAEGETARGIERNQKVTERTESKKLKS